MKNVNMLKYLKQNVHQKHNLFSEDATSVYYAQKCKHTLKEFSYKTFDCGVIKFLLSYVLRENIVVCECQVLDLDLGLSHNHVNTLVTSSICFQLHQWPDPECYLHCVYCTLAISFHHLAKLCI